MSGKKICYFLLGFAAALGIALVVRQRRGEVSGLRLWRGVLSRRYGEWKAAQIAEAVRQEYGALLGTAAQLPKNPALRMHLKDRILPGLALYRVLLQEHAGDRQQAQADVNAAFAVSSATRSRRLVAPLKLVPAPFKLFRLVMPVMMKQFPQAGWDITPLVSNQKHIAFDIKRCYYMDTLTSLGAPELTASFCANDDVLAEQLPPSIRFVRPHTLGRGDERCNFEYCRVEM